MVIAKQAVASITMGDPTTDIYMRSLVSRHKVAIQQEHLYLRIVMPARPDAASPCRQLALKGRRMRRSEFVFTLVFSPENANSESTLSDMGSFLFRLPFEARRHLRPQTLPSLERTMA